MKRLTTLIILILILTSIGCKCNCGGQTVNGTGKTDGTNQLNSSKEINVAFQGSIAHVFSNINRSVLMKSRDDRNPKDYPHLARLWVPTTVNKAELDKATGIVSTKVAIGYYVVQPLDGLAIRVVDWDGTSAKALSNGKLDYSLPDFKTMVPHLKTEVSNDTMIDIKDVVLDPKEVPDNIDFTAFFELEGGTITRVDPYCKQTKFITDYKQLGLHNFGETVTLTGTVVNDPALQFRRTKDGPWETATFTPSVKPLLIGLENLPDPEELDPMSHMMMFMRLAKTSPSTFDDVEKIKCSDHGAIPGCSNTQWP